MNKNKQRDMDVQLIVDNALEQLEKATGILGHWKFTGQIDLTGTLTLPVNGKNLSFDTQVKREITESVLPKTMKLYDENKRTFMLLAGYIPPTIKERFQSLNIPYLDAAGNIFLKRKEAHIWIEGRKQLVPAKERNNRAFTKTGLKVVFNFLLKEDRINDSYREIAKLNDVALGNINNIMNGLLRDHFLIKLNKDKYALNHKRELLNKWITTYQERLKPSLHIGNFRFLNTDNFLNWSDVKLNKMKTWWGGEPAGDFYTNYLKPQELTLYTIESRGELMKNYKLIPDETGNVKVYKKFYTREADASEENIVPTLLAYIDLILKADRRCIETAQKIYDEYLQDQFGAN